ncbi:LPS-assembly protein LptD [Asticcacaulis sp. AND118]|uniref:LPS-assembly protein LptD n=1 Tax=Asticcacaulis sp. AND118 TaxID=2840468 RepID=UPI001CFFD015|nr:LPS assembly protein LptD [Asticcacaulis sp. AND118]UDF02206.1 LPS assembly protein LptD [Asticcacaulis sp. AND118]
MRKASLKLSVGVLTLVAAGVVSGQAAARPDAEVEGELRQKGIRFFSADEGSETAPPSVETVASPAPVIAAPASAPVALPAPAPAETAPQSANEAVPTRTRRVVEDRQVESVEDIAPVAAAQARTETPTPAPRPVVITPRLTPKLTDEQWLKAERDRLNGKEDPAETAQAEETPLPDDGLGEDGAFITADEVTSPEENVMLARGKVEMRWEGRLIRADEVRYDQATGKTVASGNVQTINPDGSIQYADRLEVDNEHSAGTGDRIAYIDTENSKLFANKVERVDDQTNRLSEVIFTPCELCVKDNVTQEPTWHIQAGSITQDKRRRVVIYRNAVFKAKGVPVFYLPVLWHADVTAKRSSGFLIPKPGYSQRRGATLELPYLWAVSPYTDIIISPEFSTNLNPLLNLEVNRKFYSGDLHTRIGVTNERFFDNKGEKWGESDTRGYMLLDGKFDINEDWRWNFTAQRVWDKTSDGLLSWRDDGNGTPVSTPIAAGQPISNLYERYKIDDGFPFTGDYSSNSRRLISQINLIRQTDTAFFSASLFTFQSLAIASQHQLSSNLNNSPLLYLAQRDREQPAVAPMIDAYWSPDQDILGGRLTLSANAVSVIRKTAPSTDIFLAPDIANSNNRGSVDTARANIGLSWRRDMITPGGVKVAPFFDARQDEYYLRDYYAPGYVLQPGEKETRRVSRSLGTVGLDVSYPLLRKFQNLTVVVEPIAQLALSPDSQVDSVLTNEDSNAFEFDDTTLFKSNRSPGFDLYEGGKRLNIGVKTQLNFDSGLKVSTLVGRAFRQDPEENFYRSYTVNGTTYRYDASSLAGTKSDWVVQAEADTGKGLRLYTRQRIADDGNIRRSETGASYFSASTQLTLRHQYDKTSVRDPRNNYNFTVVNGELVPAVGYHDLQLFGRHFFTPSWGVSGQISRDMLRDRWLRSEASIIYQDDCARLELVYQRDETALLQTVPGKASESISIRISLATLAPSDDDFVNVR